MYEWPKKAVSILQSKLFCQYGFAGGMNHKIVVRVIFWNWDIFVTAIKQKVFSVVCESFITETGFGF